MFKKIKKEENPRELPKLTPVAPESINTDPSPGDIVTSSITDFGWYTRGTLRNTRGLCRVFVLFFLKNAEHE